MRTIALFSMILSFAAASAQDTIANAGFEMWDSHPAGYDVAAGWKTLNPLTNIVGVITAYKASAPADVHTGSFAIKLVTKTAGGQTAPALVTSGMVNPSGVYGGTPINSRPGKVTGWYRYFPVGSDNAIFEVFMFKAGVEIGSGLLTPADSASDWTYFEVPISYTSTETPDTARITFFASNGDSPNAAVNSTLFLDDLAYEYPTAIQPVASSGELLVFPNPASGYITVIADNMNIQSISIHSLDGKKVKDLSISSPVIEVNDLLPGKYVLTAHPAQGKSVSHVVEIQR